LSNKAILERPKIIPQKGPQEKFLRCPSDIVIYGGSAGSGKSYAALMEPLYHVGNPDFGAVIFRRSLVSITAEGALYDTSRKLYPLLGAVASKSPRIQWTFPSKARISMAHLQHDDTVFDWHGTQIPLIIFDELCEFTKHQFFYMLSRNRSTCGVKPYIRATCNPDADSWVADFISWWIDQETGYPIKERGGVIRYMIRVGDVIQWGDTPQELIERYPEFDVGDAKSVTFIPATIHDNQELLRHNPQYLANLKSLPTVERERLLHGNWKIKPAAGMFFKRSQIGDMLSVIPGDVIQWVRGWDLAATSESEGGEPAYTSGVLMGKRKDGRYVVADVINVRQSASEVRQTIKHTAQTDKAKYQQVRIRLPQDPGQAGKDQAQSYIKFLSGFSVTATLESGSKETRAEPMAAQWQAGNFDVLTADWNEAYFSQLESFPASRYKDMVDASSSAFAELELRNLFNLKALIS